MSNTITNARKLREVLEATPERAVEIVAEMERAITVAVIKALLRGAMYSTVFWLTVYWLFVR